MKSKKIICIIISALLLLVLLPLVIDWLIIGNKIPSNISSSDWVGFFGDYIGAIIGAIVSLAGIAITIRYTNSQNKKDRELQVRPYCSIKFIQDANLIGTNKILAELPIGCGSNYDNDEKPTTGIIYIKNIGLGPAVEFEFDVDELDDGREHYPVLLTRNTQTSSRATNLLQVGEEGAFPIYIWFNFDQITQNDFEVIEGLGETVKQSILNRYKSYDIVISMKYSDLYQNQYKQTIIIGVSIGAEYNTKNKAGTFIANFHLKETTIPQKTS